MDVLSPRVERLIGRVFGVADLQTRVRLALMERGGRTLPLLDRAEPAQIERIQFALLRLSEGEWDKLDQALAVAAQDWRDVLVAAGFGSSLEAHERWYEAQMDS